MTIYLLEIMGLGLILFLVAMVWQQSEIAEEVDQYPQISRHAGRERIHFSFEVSSRANTVETSCRPTAKDHSEVVPFR